MLVIIGLLLGAILKGQELVENSRVKNAANDFSSIKAAAYGYLDRYRTLAGDDGAIGAPTPASLRSTLPEPIGALA